MIETAEKHKVKLLCGHTQSYGPHIRTMRKIISVRRTGQALRSSRLGLYGLDALAGEL